LTPVNDPSTASGLTPIAGGQSAAAGLTPIQPGPLPTLTPVGSGALTPLGPTPLGSLGDTSQDWAAFESAAPAARGGLSSPNPFSSPKTVTARPQKPIRDDNRCGLPWELSQEDAKLSRTVKMVLFSPSEAFSTMRCSGGYGGPIGYLCLSTVAGIAALFGWGLLGAFAIVCLGVASGAPGEAVGGSLTNRVLSCAVAAVVFMGIGIPALIMNSFIQAGLIHVVLMMLGSARRDFEATFRVICFSLGSSALIYVIPCVASLIAPIFFLIAVITGIARAHEISGGKAALAVLAPAIVIVPIFLLLISG
jgi:hypothetical protein